MSMSILRLTATALAAAALLLTACDTSGTPQASAQAAATPTPTPRAPVTFTSDPEGATLSIGGRMIGRTPVTTELPIGQSTTYRLAPDEPYDDYDLYVPYSGTVTPPAEGTAVSVWVERTTAETQAQQRAAAEAERVRAAQERCRRQLANASLIIENWGWTRSSGYAIAEGLVTNATNQTLRNIEAEVRYSTADGQFITSDTSLIDYQDLLPGQSSPFTVYTRLNPAMSRGNLTFREFWGPPVAAISRSSVNC